MKRVVTVLLLAGCSHADPAAPAEPVDDAAVDGDAAIDAPKGPSPTEIARFEKVRAEIAAAMKKSRIPGASVAVVLRGELAFAEGFGVKKEGTEDAVTPDSLFRVASMTKPIVTMGILEQVEAGTMALGDRLRKYLPKFDRSGGDPNAVKLQHLLSHTAGIPDEGPYKCKTDPSYMATWLTARNVEPLWTPPGRLYNYSNGGFGLAAYALQEVTKQPFTVYLKDNVLAKAGMETATFDPAEASADQTFGHDRANKRVVDFTNEDCAVMRGYMGIMASAKDYAHYAQHVMANDGVLVQPDSLAQMEAPTTPTGYAADTMGLGLFGTDWRDTHLAFHDGRATGWESSLIMVPSERLAVIILVNVDDYSPMQLALRSVDLLRGTDSPPPDYATPVSTWNVYAGEYEDPFAWLGKITVTKSATGLMISIPNHGVDRALEQTGGDSFAFNYESKWNSGTFFKDSSGVGEYFATRFGVAKRTATSPPPPPAAPAPGPAPKATPAYDPAMWAHAHDHRSSWLRP